MNHAVTVIVDAHTRPCPVIMWVLSNGILGNRRKSQTEGGVDKGVSQDSGLPGNV